MRELGMPGAETAVGAPSNGATMPEAGAPNPLGNDPVGHGHRPHHHHHDHHSQPKMPQAGVHGAGVAMAAGRLGMVHELKSISVFEFLCFMLDRCFLRF